MKKTGLVVMAIALALYCAPAFAQHGHGAGPGNAMGGASHASANTNSASGAAAAHGKTMDQLLTQNKGLSGKIASLTGEPAQQACSGFKNLGQCVAAAHVSKNLGIGFACLKSNMTGTAAPTGSNCSTGPSATSATGAKTMSLGKAIQTLSPATNSKTEAKKGEQQASQDLKASTKNS